MKFTTKQYSQRSSIIGNIAMTLTIATVLNGIAIMPAFADDDDRHRDNRDKHHRERYERHDHRDAYRGRRDPYYYSAPVYVPPVYYAPQPSAGITLFFPIDLRR